MPSHDYDDSYFSDDGDDYYDRPPRSSRRRSAAPRTWARDSEGPGIGGSIQESLRRTFSRRDDSEDREIRRPRERRMSTYPTRHEKRTPSCVVTGPNGVRGVWLYSGPGASKMQRYPTPPPKAHGWTKMFLPYDEDDFDRFGPSMVEPHSPDALEDRSSSQRARRHSPYRGDRHYSDAYTNWRSDRDENNARRRAKQYEAYRAAYEYYCGDDDGPEFDPSSPRGGSSYSRRSSPPPSFSYSRHSSPSPSSSYNRRSSPPRSSYNRQPSPPSPGRTQRPDYYRILRVSPSATQDEIRAAAKKRRIEVHPDKVRREAAKKGKTISRKEEEDMERMAKEVGEAAEVLENRESKREYDDDRRFGGR